MSNLSLYPNISWYLNLCGYSYKSPGGCSNPQTLYFLDLEAAKAKQASQMSTCIRQLFELRHVTTSTTKNCHFNDTALWLELEMSVCGTYAESEKIRAPWPTLFCLLASLGYPLPMPSLFTAASKDETPQLSSFGSILDNFLLWCLLYSGHLLKLQPA